MKERTYDVTRILEGKYRQRISDMHNELSKVNFSRYSMNVPKRMMILL